MREGGRRVSNQGNGVDEFRASLLEIHGASTLSAVAGVTQLRLRFNWHLNSVYDRNSLMWSSMCTSHFPKNTMKTTINQRDRGRIAAVSEDIRDTFSGEKPDYQQIPASSARVPTVPPNGAAFHTVSPTDKRDFSS